jgi:hypothetical protein
MIPWKAILSFAELLLIFIALACGYGLLLRRLSDFATECRLELAEVGEKYLRTKVPRVERDQIEFYLDCAFSPWPALATAFLLPLFLLKGALGLNSDLNMPIADHGTHNHIAGLFTISAFAANPLFGILVLGELLVAGFVLIIVVGNLALLKRTLRLVVGKESGQRVRRVPAQLTSSG